MLEVFRIIFPPAFFRILRSIFPKDMDGLRNAGVKAWIGTFPDGANLERFLLSIPEHERQEIRYSCRAIYEATNTFLEKNVSHEPGSSRIDTERFHLQLRSHLLERFTWMDDATFARLKSYTGWLIMREGY